MFRLSLLEYKPHEGRNVCLFCLMKYFKCLEDYLRNNHTHYLLTVECDIILPLTKQSVLMFDLWHLTRATILI